MQSIVVNELYENRLNYTHPKKIESVRRFMRCFPSFIQTVADGEIITEERMLAHPYYDYLMSKVNTRIRSTRKGRRQVLNKMRDAISLFNDIEKNGLINPLEFHIYKGKMCLYEGGRRIVILKILGYELAPINIHKDN